MSAEKVANRYTTALIELCESNLNDLKKNLAIIDEIAELFKVPAISKILMSPTVGLELKGEVIEAAAQQIGTDILMSSYLELIVKANRVSAIPTIARTLKRAILHLEGTVEADVVTVFDLVDDELLAVKGNLEAFTKKSVILTNTVEKSILGGCVVRIGNSVIDMSLKTKLDAMTQAAAK